MKKLKVKKGSTCMACLACVGACSEAFYKVFDPDKACLQIVEKKAVRPIACPQCGKCAEPVRKRHHPEPEGRLHDQQEKMYGMRSLCEGLSIWPDRKNRGKPASKCIACGICAKACPMDVLEVVDE